MNETNETRRLAYTIPEAAALVGISADRYYSLARDGKAPFILIGERQKRVGRRQLERWLEERATAAAGLELAAS